MKNDDVIDPVTSRVARQYTEHAYPPAPADLGPTAGERASNHSDPGVYSDLLWPEGRLAEGLDVLIAGCGTFQAAVTALNNPSCRVTGVDLSETSLGRHAMLREKHGLSNLELVQADLRRVGELGRDFDLVVSTGVLHHLEHPSEGLSALRRVMRRSAALYLMVYGTTLRTGVYMLQDAFRRMGMTQSTDDIVTARQIIESLPAHHFIHAYRMAAPELSHDAALVDTFLHSQDRAFTVPQLLEWVDANGLEFQGWASNANYYPHALVPNPASERIRSLPDREQWAVVEQLLCVAGAHFFICRLPGEARTPRFDNEDWRNYRPRLRPDAELASDGQLRVARMGFQTTPAEAAAIRRADGEATIGEIIQDAAFSAFGAEARAAFGCQVFERLWKIGAVTLHMAD